MSELLDSLKALPFIEKRRQCGTMAAFNIVNSEGYDSLKSQQWQKRFLERGLLLRHLGSVIYMLPPYCIPMTALREAYLDLIEIITRET